MARLLFGILFCVSLILPLKSINAIETGINVGDQAPHFELKDLSGKTVRPLESKGKIILLNFWSTLCSPCVAEMPSLNNLQASLKGHNFEVVAVAIDSSDKPVREFLSGKNLTFPVLLDPEKEVFFDLYAGPVLPAAYLIDRNGIIVETFSGPQKWDSPQMKDNIRKVLEKR